MLEQVRQKIHHLICQLEKDQSDDGAWRYCCESGPMTDAYMILLLQVLGLHDKNVIRSLSSRLHGLQQDNGAWSLFHDEPLSGNLSATIEAYYALLSTGHYKANDESIQKASLFIRQNGGFARVGMSTRAMLACTGQLPWKHYRVPLIWTLFPKWFPLNFFDFVGYARGHIAPVLIVATCESSERPSTFPDLNTLLMEAGSKAPNKRSHPVRLRKTFRSSRLRLYGG